MKEFQMEAFSSSSSSSSSPSSPPLPAPFPLFFFLGYQTGAETLFIIALNITVPSSYETVVFQLAVSEKDVLIIFSVTAGFLRRIIGILWIYLMITNAFKFVRRSQQNGFWRFNIFIPGNVSNLFSNIKTVFHSSKVNIHNSISSTKIILTDNISLVIPVRTFLKD